MKKILPIHYPIIQHKPADAFLLSIIGERPDEYAWIMNNFVNLRYNPQIKYDDFFRNDMWYNCYHITESKFTKEFIDLFSENPFENLKRMIDAGYYVYMFLNRRFIHNYNKPEYDIRHNPLIYGYDTEKDLIYIADFFRGKGFNFETCSISEFCQSYPYTDDEDEFYIYVWNRAIKKKEGYEYNFNLEDLIVKLEDYVKGIDLNASRYYPFDTNDVEEVEYMHIDGGYNYVYGLNVYDAICEDLVKNELSHRPMHLLYEHKSLMCKRILFLIENGFLIAETKLQCKCENLRNDFLLLRNLFLKYKISNELTKKHRLEICDRLMRLKEEDRAFTIELIDEIRSERK